jgi:RecJ-like exonuclease
MEGIITSVKNPGTVDATYFVLSGRGAEARLLPVGSSLSFSVGERVKVDSGAGTLVGLDAASDAIKEATDAARECADEALLKKRYKAGIEAADKVTERMWTRLNAAASLFLSKLALGAPVIVRFHNDADGSSGAYGLFKSLEELSKRKAVFSYRHNITWIMQNSVSYDPENAGSDILITNAYESVSKPLLLMIDFGTSAESNTGLDMIKKKFDIIWLDHHPVVEGFNGSTLEHYINPWLHGGDSNYTGGFLACVFSKSFADIDTRTIEEASFVGDYSEFVRKDRKGAELGTLLDLITSDVEIAFGASNTNLTPYEIDKLLKDEAKCKELLGYASMRLSEALESALASVKIYNTGIAKIYALDYEGVRIEYSKYPLPGRFSSKLLDKITELNELPCIVILHSGRYISIRARKDIGEKVDVLGLIGELKTRHAGEIVAGGGHKNAAGIKLADTARKATIVKDLVTLMKEKLDTKSD